MTVLITQTSYKKRLIDGQITAKELVSMKKEDFKSEEEKRKKEEAAAAKMQANRTDWAREQDKAGGIADGFFTCKRCKSKKTTFYQ